MALSATKIEAVFAEAIELPAGPARAQRVNELCAGDSALLQEVESLLQAHEQAADFLQDSPLPKPTPQAEPPPRLAGFRIERKLGEGSLGVVYAAQDEKLGRRVAIKVLRGSAGDSLQRRVLEEARKTAALNDPAIVTVFSVLDESQPPAIIMEWVEGYSLDQFAAQLSFEQKARLLKEVARGLAAAHARGLVHRDIKPDNIVVGPDLRPRILDFGLALSLEEAAASRAVFEGTPLYASPEQATGQALTPASDVFSFGSLMFKVLTGHPPFAGQSVAQVLEAIRSSSPPILREIAAGVPEDLQAICLACLSPAPADRPKTEEIVEDLGRFLIGEPARLRPKLYADLLRRRISEQDTQLRTWEDQSIISREERDAFAVVNRRLLADEDHWFIDARRITGLQTMLSSATWLTVVATILTVWLLRPELSPLWRWLLPTGFAGALLLTGLIAQRARETLFAATFLAGATLAMAPAALAWLADLGIWSQPATGIEQLFKNTFTNQQVFASALLALGISLFCWRRLKMTGFAWTSAVLGVAVYLGLLLQFNWLSRKLEIQALWCLPLAAFEPVALRLERCGRVRWTLPFHLVALAALLVSLDLMALKGPTLKMLGLESANHPFFDEDRLTAFSVALNGLLFLGLMLGTEKSSSLDLRRASRWLEVLALVHTLSALFANAMSHRTDPHVRIDVALYLFLALAFLVLAPFRSRWRMLVGGLLGCGLGSYLLVDLGLVARKPFILSLGVLGLLAALGTFAYVRRRPGT